MRRTSSTLTISASAPLAAGVLGGADVFWCEQAVIAATAQQTMRTARRTSAAAMVLIVRATGPDGRHQNRSESSLAGDLSQLCFDLARARVGQRRPVGEFDRRDGPIASVDRADEIRGRRVVLDVHLVVLNSLGFERCLEPE